MANKFIIEIRTRGFKGAEDDLKKVGKQTRKLARDANKAGKAGAFFRRTMSQLRNNLLLVSFAFGAVILTIKRFIDASAGFEKVKTRLVGLTGSVENAERAFDKFNKVAATTPFSLQDVVEAGAQLKAFGADAEALIKPISDLAAFMGTTAVEAANAFGRAFAGGAGAADILRERGILNIIKTSQGLTDLSKTTLPNFRKALIKSLQDPAVGIAGSTERLSKTYVGVMSNMLDSTTRLAASVGNLLVPAIKTNALETTNMMNVWTEFITKLGETQLETTLRHLKEMGIEAKKLAELQAAVITEKAVKAVEDYNKEISSLVTSSDILRNTYSFLFKEEEKLRIRRGEVIDKTKEYHFITEKSNLVLELAEGRVNQLHKTMGDLITTQELESGILAKSTQRLFDEWVINTKLVAILKARLQVGDELAKQMEATVGFMGPLPEDKLLTPGQRPTVGIPGEEAPSIFEILEDEKEAAKEWDDFMREFLGHQPDWMQMHADNQQFLIDLAAERRESILTGEQQFYEDMQALGTQFIQQQLGAWEQSNRDEMQLNVDIARESTQFKRAQRRKDQKEMDRIINEAKNKNYQDRLNKFRADQLLAISNIAIDYMQASAKSFAQYGPIFGLSGATAMQIMSGLQVAAVLAQPKPKKFAQGGDFVTSGPQSIMVGDNPGGRERVQVTPLSSPNISGPAGGGVNITFSGNVLSQDFIENEAIPQIREALRRGESLPHKHEVYGYQVHRETGDAEWV